MRADCLCDLCRGMQDVTRQPNAQTTKSKKSSCIERRRPRTGHPISARRLETLELSVDLGLSPSDLELNASQDEGHVLKVR
eukprot:4117368-Prymnesium_polylepis.1